jgi:hypothetical protein
MTIKSPTFAFNSSYNIKQEHLSRYTHKSIQASCEISYDPCSVLKKLKDQEGIVGVAIGIGGTNLYIQPFRIQEGAIEFIESIEGCDISPIHFSSRNGENYFRELKKISKSVQGIPKGIAVAGLVSGTCYLGTNIPVFMEEFGNQFGGDFAMLFDGDPITVINDGVAIAAGASMELFRTIAQKHNMNVLVQIMGTGNGFTVFLADGQIIPTEPGQLDGADFNIFGTGWSTELSSGKIALESLSAGPGISAAFEKLEGIKSDAKGIAEKHLACGNRNAMKVFAHSAMIAAQQFIGMMHCFDICLEDTLLVANGGVWRAVGYKNLVSEIIRKHFKLEEQIPIYHTDELIGEIPADIMGAALFAVLTS